MGLSSSDEHLFLCEMLGHGTQYDQLNLPDLALDEATQRRLQMWKERYAEKLRASTTGGVSAVMPRSDISFWVGLDQMEALWWPKNWKNGSPLSWHRRQPSSWKEEKDVKAMNWER